jgi:hypothetical protein
VVDLADAATLSAGKTSLLFSAGQAISSAPVAVPFSAIPCAGCWMVNVVTGKPTTGVLLIENAVPQQTAYGILDKATKSLVQKSSLVPQVLDTVVGNAFTVKNRPINYGPTTSAAMGPANRLGWSFDLPPGQMTVANPFMRDNGSLVFFGINVSPLNICPPTLSGQVWEVLSVNGNVSTAGIDINGDFKVDAADLVLVSGGTKGSAAGVNTDNRQMGGTQVVEGYGGNEHAIQNNGKPVTGKNGGGGGGGTGGPKRLAWREITP